MNRRKKIAIVATVPMVVKLFLQAHIKKLSENYDVYIICPNSNELIYVFDSDGVKYFTCNFIRKINVIEDLKSLFKLWWIFYRNGFDAIISIMPKSGLLSMVAGRFARIPFRLHIFTGQVWASETGRKRQLLIFLDRILASAATHLLADSPTQRKILVRSKIVPSTKIRVLGKGSISGVDVDRFKPNLAQRCVIRRKLNISTKDIVILFLGRVNRAKGIIELIKAFKKLFIYRQDVHLFVVGPDDDNLDNEIRNLTIGYSNNFHRVGFTNVPEDYMAMADIFAIPSHREGFGQAVIEASSVGLPTVASRIYGLYDSVQADVTGIFHAPRDEDDIYRALKIMCSSKTLMKTMGNQARARVVKYFKSEAVVAHFREFVGAELDKDMQKGRKCAS